MAEVLLRDRFGPGSPHHVVSAGVHAVPGRPASDGAVAAMARRGLDLSEHTSRPLDAEDLSTADLVVTMESQHLVELVSAHPGALDRTFTLRELVGLVHDDAVVWSPSDRRVELVAPRERSVRAHLGRSDLDVVDPIGRSRWHYRRCADDLAGLCDELATWMGA